MMSVLRQRMGAFVFVLLSLIFVTLVSAASYDIGTIFDDTVNTYTVNTPFSVGTVVVGVGAIYFDDVEYCEWQNRSYLTTARVCPYANIDFVSPTPADLSNVFYGENVLINVSIESDNLSDVIYSFDNINRSGLVLDLDFDFSGNFTDASGSGNDGTNSGATWSSGGVFGSGAYSFDGVDDYISLPDSADFETSTVSISAWIKNNDPAATYEALINFHDETGPTTSRSGYGLYYNYEGENRFTFRIFPEGSTAGQKYVRSSVVNDNDWHHVVSVWEDGMTYPLIYVDGVLDLAQNYSDTSDTTITYPSGYGPHIGDTSDPMASNFFNGSIDEVTFWNRSLSASEVGDLYNASKHNYLDDSLVLMMNFDSYTLLNDTSGQGNDGTNNGATWVSSGKYGGAYSFDGSNDYVDLGNSIDFSGSEYSFSFWYKVGGGASFDDQGVIGKGGGSNTANDWWIEFYDSGSDGTGIFRFQQISDNTYDTVTSFDSSSGWVYLTYVINATSMKWYVDGELDASYGSPPTLVNSEDLVVGHFWNRHCNGLVDELRIYNRSISAQEIGVLYESSLNKFNSTHWNLTVNKSGLSVGSYSYSVDGVDSSGSANSTSVRILNVVTGNVEPQVSFVSPTPDNGSNVTYGQGFLINASIVDSNLEEVEFIWEEPVDGQILNLKFDTDGNLSDSSGSGYDATNVGVSWTADGKYDGAYSFDGGTGDYIWIDNYPNSIRGSEFSFGYWVKINGAGDTTSSKLIAHTDASNAVWDATWDSSASTFNCYFYGDDAGSLVTANTYNTGEWYHVFYTANTTTQKVYVNGVSENSRTGSFSYSTANVDMWFGRRYASYSGNYYTLNGVLDEIRVYNTSLSADDVGRIYNSTKTKFYDDSLVAMYNFDSYTLLNDTSGNSNDGTNNGAIWSSSGKYGGAYSFDGSNDYVQLPVGAGWGRDDTVTMSMWFKTSVGGGLYDVEYTLDNDNIFAFKPNVRADNGNLEVWALGVNNGWGSRDDLLYNVANDYRDNNWHLLTFIYTGGTTASLDVYVDGEYKGSDTASFSNFDWDASDVSGRTLGYSKIYYMDGGTTANYWFNGLIDEVRIYNRSLSANEIVTLYESSLNKFNSTHWNLTVNKSILDVGSYSYSVDTVDSSGLINVSEVRTLNVVDINAAPQVSFVDPTPVNDTSSSNTSYLINVSIQDTSLKNISLHWNGSVEGCIIGDGYCNDSYNDRTNSNDLVLAMSFDNSSDYSDWSGNSNDGSNSGSTWVSSGKYGGARSFDGSNDYISISNSAEFDFSSSDDFAITMWVKPNTAYSGYILDKAANLGSNGQYHVTVNYASGDTLYCQVGKEGTGWESASSVSTYSDEWVFLVCNKDGNNLQIYTNNVNEANTTIVNSVSASANGVELHIGHHRRGWLGDYYEYGGLLDELRIYNRSLSSAEIEELYYSGLKKINSTNWYITFNKTGLDVGSYEYSVSVNDSSGLSNVTESRTLEIIAPSVAPQVSFVSPTPDNGSNVIYSEDVWINASIVETDLSDVIFEFSNVGSEGLILDLDFDFEGNLTDGSGSGNYGTNYGATWTSSGKYGIGAYDFDGSNDYILIDDTSSIDVASQLTISFWQKLSSYSSVIPISKQGDGGIYLQYNNVNIAFLRFGGSTTLDTTGMLAVDKWHHIVIRNDGSNTRLFIDGVAVSGSVAGGVPSTTTNLLFGAYGAGDTPTGYWSNGQLDELKIWDRGLSDSEISSLYNYSKHNYLDDSLVLMMNFDSYTLLNDTSGNSNDGTNNGATWTSSGKYGGAYSFNGASGYIDVSSSPEFGFGTKDFSVNTWVNFKDRNDVNLGLFAIGGYTNFGVRTNEYTSNQLSVYLSSTHYSYSWSRSPNTWYYFSLNRNGNNLDFYVNGDYVGTNDISGKSISANSIRLGHIFGGSMSSSFNGNLDELRVYNRSLSVSEIKTLYESSLNKYNSTYWNFTVNKSILDVGSYSYSVDAVDSSGSINSTEVRTFSVFAPNVAPQVSFVSPTPDNGTNINYGDYVLINASIVESDLIDVIYEFRNINRSGLILDLDFDFEGNLTDGSGSSNYGTNYGATWTSSGKYGIGAYDFDGSNDYILIDDTSSIDVASQLTISFWQKLSSYSSVIPISKQGDSGFYLQHNNVNSAFLRFGGSTTLDTTGMLAVDKWHHIVIRNDGSNTRLFIDGVAVSGSVAGGVPSTTTNLLFGAYGAGDTPTGYWSNGQLDELKIWDRGLSDSEISSLYNYSKHNYLDDSLVLMMNFDSYTLLNDTSGNSNDGTNNGATWVSGGKYGGAYSFNGNDYVVVPDNSELSITSDLTIGAWVKFSNMNTGTVQSIVDKYDATGVQRSYALALDHGDCGDNQVALVISSTTNPYTGFGLCSNIALSADVWYHVVSVFDAGNYAKIYINGVDSTGTLVGTLQSSIADSTRDLSIGAGFTNSAVPDDTFVVGLIDEIRIYNRSLSNSEVKSLYESSLNKYNSTHWNLSVVKSGLDVGSYLYSVDAVDSSGGSNSTETRVVNVIVDNVAPQVSFVSPTPENGTSSTTNAFLINVSVLESNVSNVTLDFDGNIERCILGNSHCNATFNDLSNTNGLKLGVSFEGLVDYSDWSGNIADGSGSGSTWTADGKYGAARNFDGSNDYVQFENNFNGLIDYTMSAWVKPTGTHKNYHGTVVSSGNWNNNHWAMTVNQDNGAFGSNRAAADASYTIPVNEWTMLTIVRDGTDVDYYANGVYVSSSTDVTGALVSSESFTRIGSDTYTGTDYYFAFKGYIDEVRIYNRSFNSSEVWSLYSGLNYEFNVSNLGVGSYNYSLTVYDTDGLSNTTETRVYTVLGVAPQISFVSPTPANDISSTNTSYVINVSLVESSLKNITFDFNGSVETCVIGKGYCNDSFNDKSNTDGLVLAISFDDGSDGYDWSDNGNNGTINGPTWNAAGKYGGAFSFDNSNDYISVAEDFVGLTDYSFSAWIKVSGNHKNSFGTLISSGNWNNDYWAIALNQDNSGFRSMKHGVSAPYNFVVGEWTHIAITRSGTDIVYYVNGNSVLGATDNSGAFVSASNEVTHIGSDTYADNYFTYNGFIDELRLYNRSLSASEVELLYSGINLNFNKSSLSVGNYSYSATAYDTDGLSNSTEVRSLSVLAPAIALPGVSIVSPTPDNNASVFENSGVLFNISVDKEVNNCTLKIGTNTGDGSDGNLVVSSANTIVNHYTYLLGNESDKSITVENAFGFSPGDLVLIVQTQNVTGGIAGQYEYRKVDYISGTDIVLDSLSNSYYSGRFNTSFASVTQVIRVPQYDSIVVNSGASIVPKVWDGYTGGIVVFKSRGDVNISGSIDAVGFGFRGGAGRTVIGAPGEQGESYGGLGTWSNSVNFGAGGGGQSAGWDSERGGGGGGHATVGTDGPSSGGPGGIAYGSANLSLLHLGSGGGGGGHRDDNGEDGGDGSSGGGAVIIYANEVNVNGIINVSGATASGGDYHGGKGGGGSGGTVYISAEEIDIAGSVVAAGGIGETANSHTHLHGGDGAVGRIRLDYTVLSGVTSPSAGYIAEPAVMNYSMQVNNNGALTSANYLHSGFSRNNYEYKFSCVDSGANSGISDIRVLNVIGDLPDVTFVSPTENNGASVYAGQSLEFNVSVNENVSSCSLEISTPISDETDGVVTISSSDTIINTYTYLKGNESDVVISVNDSTGFSSGDEVLVIQTQNTSGGIAGQYEFASVVSINGNNITLDALSNNYYSGTFNVTSSTVTQVIRVPQYTDLTVNSGASIVAKPWDGYSGGVVVFKASGDVNVAGSINVSDRGFRGGAGRTTSGASGHQGEGYNGFGTWSNSVNVGGGAGGQSAGWASERGGGGAGYGAIGMQGPSSGGLGGIEYGYANLSLLHLGSGGGGGGHRDDNGEDGGPGSNGAGLIIIYADSLSNTGSILANAIDASGGDYHGGKGGGGSGGTVYISANQIISSGSFSVSGGLGETANEHTHLHGGDGAVGRARLDYKGYSGLKSYNVGYTGTPSVISSSMQVVNDSESTFAYKNYGALAINDYSYLVECVDAFGNLNSSNIRTLSVVADNTAPSISIDYPVSTQYAFSVSVLNYTASDGVALNNCWYSKDSGVSNSSSVIGGVDFTGVTSVEGNNNWTVYCDDASGNVGSTFVAFVVDTISPVVNITDPLPQNYEGFPSNLEYTVSDANAKNCWYSKNLGQTNSSAVSAGIVFGGMTSAEGSNTWTVYCNDYAGNVGSDTVTFSRSVSPPSDFEISVTTSSSITESGLQGWFAATGNKNMTKCELKNASITEAMNKNSDTYYTNSKIIDVEGTYTFDVVCEAVGGETDTVQIQFVYDIPDGLVSTMNILNGDEHLIGDSVLVNVSVECSGVCNNVTIFLDPIPGDYSVGYFIVIMLVAVQLLGTLVYKRSRGQTSVEQIVITAVVIVIAIVVVEVLVGGLSIASGLGKDTNDRVLASQEVAVVSYAVRTDGTVLNLKNNKPDMVRVTEVVVNGTVLDDASLPLQLQPGQTKQITTRKVTSFTEQENLIGEEYKKNIKLTYSDVVTGGTYVLGDKDDLFLLGQYAGSAGTISKGIIGNNSNEDFYIVGDSYKSCSDMVDGETCYNVFNVNASGSVGNYLFFGVITADNIATVNSNTRTVKLR